MTHALLDLIDMPGFNPTSQHDRGEWGLRCVTDGSVTADAMGRPRCVDHGAMNAVNEDRTLWRCLNCGRGCFRPAATTTGLYGVDTMASSDFDAHVLTDDPGPGLGTRLARCGISHRLWRPVSEFARPDVFTPCAACHALNGADDRPRAHVGEAGSVSADDFSPATAAGEVAQVGEGTGVRVNDAGTDPGGGPGAGPAPGVHDATIAAMLTQRCGRCKAVPGEPCRTERGNPSYGPHTSRWYAARRAGVLPDRGAPRGS